MNKKTVYDELFGYKIPEDDVIKISNTFIFCQEKSNNILLIDLIHLFHKKIDFEQFERLIHKAHDNKVVIPIDLLIKSSLYKNDLINLFQGWIYALSNQLQPEFSELEYFAIHKTNISYLIDSVISLNKYDNTVSLVDFKNCTFAQLKPKEYSKALINIYLSDEKISIKQLISFKYTLEQLINFYQLFLKIKNKDVKLTISDLINFSKQGLNAQNIVTGILLSISKKINLSQEEIIAIEELKEIPADVIKLSYTPVNEELKQITAVVEKGYEVIFKVELKTTINLSKFFTGYKKNELFRKINNIFISEIFQYKDFVTVKSQSFEISQKVLEKLQNENSIYNILSITILDIIIGKNLIAEQLKVDQEIFEREAFIAEAKVRIVKANLEMEKFVSKTTNKVKDNIHGNVNENTSHKTETSEKPTH